MTMKAIVALLLLVCMLFIPAQAQETPAGENIGHMFQRFFGNIDTVNISVGSAQLQLENPDGFDVATEVFDDGEAPSDAFSSGLLRHTLSAYGEHDSTRPWLRRRFALSYDREDFEGLFLRAVVGEAGLVAQSGGAASSINIGASVGTGLTRSNSFSDDAYHPLLQLSVHARVSVWRLFLEVVALQRLNLSATLDGRSASPHVSSSTIMIGFQIW